MIETQNLKRTTAPHGRTLGPGFGPVRAWAVVRQMFAVYSHGNFRRKNA
jgi:hypothetical protein